MRTRIAGAITTISLLIAVVYAGGAALCPFQQDPSIVSGYADQAQIAFRYLEAKSGPDIQASSIPRHNLIDDYIFGKMDRDRIPSADLSTDGEFIRRVYLDLTGRIPSSQAVRAFLGDRTPDKRDRLVDSLIGTSEYVDRWTMWFGDRFRNTIYPASAAGRTGLDL